MIIMFNISGLNAMQTRIDVNAYNTSNSMTSSFRPQTVTLSDTSTGGVTASVQRSESNSNDMAGNMIDDTVSLRTYQANAKMIQTQDQMIGTLLNITA